MMLEMLRDQLNRGVPFAVHSGVRLTELDHGHAAAALDQTPNSVNHIGSQHAGALFTLGEAASGAAMAGMFAPVLMDIRPVTAEATIQYRRIAKGRITATATAAIPADELLASLARDGRVAFAIGVTMTDESGTEVATMQVSWHISGRQRAA